MRGRVAFFFHRIGFQILQWEPEAVKGRPGDLEIRWRDTEPIFVEVKGPGWKGELTADEIKVGRSDRPKHVDGEGRAVGPIRELLEYCASFVKVGDHILLWKSLHVTEEIETSANAQKILNCTLVDSGSDAM